MADNIKIIDPYQNYDIVPQGDANGIYGNDFLTAVKSLQVGFGNQVMRVDRQGIWLGSAEFASAPFRVDMAGNATATSLSISGYVPTGGALADVGVGNITGTYISSGAITTAKLSATAIDGMTITGARVRTSSGSSRVQMNESTNALEVYSSSTKRIQLNSDELKFYNSSGTERGGIKANTTEVYVSALNGGNLTLEAIGSSYTVIFQVAGTIRGYFTTQGLNMSGYKIQNIDTIRMNGKSIGSGTLSNGELGYHDNGSTQGMRCRVGGFNGQIDLTAF